MLFDSSLADAVPSRIVVDYNDVVYVLTDQGVGRVFDGRVVKDLLYRPLQGRLPLDISVAEGSGYLYYLYPDEILSNTRAGTISIPLPAGSYESFRVAADGSVLLHGPAGLTLYRKGKFIKLKKPLSGVRKIYVNDNTFFASSDDVLFILRGDSWMPLLETKKLQSVAFTGDTVYVGTPDGYQRFNMRNSILSAMEIKVPVRDIQQLQIVDGRLWAGTPQGAFTERQEGGYDYYASKRWLADDHVLGMAHDSKSRLYFLSPEGVTQISFQPFTYHDKAVYFQDKIRQRHIRYGFIAELRLKRPGDLASAEMIDTDNDGLWSSFYLGSQALRYAVTGEPIARDYAWETFEAYERIISINPLKGFPARTFERTGFKVSDPQAWRPGKDAGWEWKGTTSSDEFVGYIFVAALMDQFVAKERQEKKRIADFIDKILTHIIENDYNFVDADGKPTRWGRWHPDYINGYAKTISDRKLGATHLIAGLQLGFALTGKKIYKDEAFRMMNDHGYLENILISPYDIKATEGYIYDGTDMGMGPWNHSDDEMEFLSYWVLHHYAFDKKLQQKYGRAIREFWQIELPEKHPAWNLITLGTEGSFDRESTLWYLREFPMDMIRWDIKNSMRKDLDFLAPNFRQQFTKEVLSPRERPTHRYNANEFILDGGSGGKRELTGAEYLLPYWMARYLKVITD